jgi:hypothetical protein
MTEEIADATRILHAAAQLAQWLPWAELASVAFVAGALGWGARMLREERLARVASE